MRWLLEAVEPPTQVREPPGLRHPTRAQALGDPGQSLASTPPHTIGTGALGILPRFRLKVGELT